MALMIKGLHIEELIIGTEYEEEQTVQPQDEPKKEEPKKAEPKEKPKTTKKAKPIDKGKIGALRKAGWTIAEIADEMKCNQPTVHKVLEELKEMSL